MSKVRASSNQIHIFEIVDKNMKISEKKLALVTALVAQSHGFVLEKPKKGDESKPMSPRHIIFQNTGSYTCCSAVPYFSH